MTGRDWQAGDAAVLRCDDLDCDVSEHTGILGKSGDWWLLDLGEYALSKYVEPVRPLVTIDPEDREQVERLADEYHHAKVGHRLGNCYPAEYDQMQAALREFADPPTPPRPDEPTGLGAVIKDTEGSLWVRASNDEPQWRRDCDARWESWAEINVARELHAGWSE